MSSESVFPWLVIAQWWWWEKAEAKSFPSQTISLITAAVAMTLLSSKFSRKRNWIACCSAQWHHLLSEWHKLKRHGCNELSASAHLPINVLLLSLTRPFLGILGEMMWRLSLSPWSNPAGSLSVPVLRVASRACCGRCCPADGTSARREPGAALILPCRAEPPWTPSWGRDRCEASQCNVPYSIYSFYFFFSLSFIYLFFNLRAYSL